MRRLSMSFYTFRKAAAKGERQSDIVERYRFSFLRLGTEKSSGLHANALACSSGGVRAKTSRK